MLKRTFETDEQAYNAVLNYYLEYSRRHHRFPRVRNAKKSLKIPINKSLSDYAIDLESSKLEVLKQRIDEIYSQYLDPSKDEINAKLGVNISNWVKRLGFDSFSDMRFHKTRKETRKKQRTFKTRKEASQAIENYFLDYLMAEHRLPPIMHVQKVLKTDRGTYLKPEGVKKIKVRVLRKRLAEIRKENPNPKKSEIEAELGINLDNWLKPLGFESYPEFYSAYTGKVTKREMLVRRKFVKTIRKGKTFNEKNKVLSTYTSLILKLIKPKNISIITEEEMWNYIKEKTGEPPDSFDVSNSKEFLRCIKKIEGSKLNGGYWRVE